MDLILNYTFWFVANKILKTLSIANVAWEQAVDTSGQASVQRAATKVTFAMDKAFKIRLLSQIKKTMSCKYFRALILFI